MGNTPALIDYVKKEGFMQVQGSDELWRTRDGTTTLYGAELITWARRNTAAAAKARSASDAAKATRSGRKY